MKTYLTKSHFYATLTTLIIVSAPSIGLTKENPQHKQKLLHQEDFETDLSQWLIEQAPGGSATVKNGKLHINDAKVFANTTRGGSFKNYHSLRLYYVGYGANNNTTTRFRRYPGDGSRPCLPEHDLTEKKFLHKANQTIKISIITDGNKIQYLRNGEIIFDFEDPNPFKEGWFGFRTVRNHMQIDNFKIHRLLPVTNQ